LEFENYFGFGIVGLGIFGFLVHPALGIPPTLTEALIKQKVTKQL